MGGFLLETDATFNTNKLNLPLSVFVGITNTDLSFPVAYCYITSKSAECFTFIIECMKELIFYDDCPGPGVILGDFAAGLTVAMQRKAKAPAIDLDAALTIAREVAKNLNQSTMKAGEERCILQL